MLDMSDAFDSLLSAPIKVYRSEQGASIVEGRLVSENKTEVLDTIGSVQHVDPKTLAYLPEGYAIGSYRTVYTPFALRMASSLKQSEGVNTVADKIEYLGVVYEVIGISDRQDTGFTKAFVAAPNQ